MIQILPPSHLIISYDHSGAKTNISLGCPVDLKAFFGLSEFLLAVRPLNYES